MMSAEREPLPQTEAPICVVLIRVPLGGENVPKNNSSLLLLSS